MGAAFCLLASLPFADQTDFDEARIERHAMAQGQLMGMLDSFKPVFDIVTPLGSAQRSSQIYTPG